MDTKKQKKPLLIIICILSALLVLGLVLGLTVFSKFRMYTIFSNRGSRLYSPAQIRDIKSDAYDKGANDFVDDMKGRLENGTGINTVLREIYTEDFIYTVDGKYYFSPINFDLKMTSITMLIFQRIPMAKLHILKTVPLYRIKVLIFHVIRVILIFQKLNKAA